MPKNPKITMLRRQTKCAITTGIIVSGLMVMFLIWSNILKQHVNPIPKANDVPSWCRKGLADNTSATPASDRRKMEDILVNDLVLYPCLRHSMELTNNLISCVHLFKEPANLVSKSCRHAVQYKTPNGYTPICIYAPDDDIWISKSLKRRKVWEADLVASTTAILQDNPGMVYVDLGCNIGAYTLAVAKMGRKVISVDPLLENLRMLSHSLNKGKLAQNVTLIWNAVSNTRQFVTFEKARQPNVGGTKVKAYKGGRLGGYSYMAETIILDNIIPLLSVNASLFLKMDIEGYELNALLGARRFFEVLNVRYIQLETVFHMKNKQILQILDILHRKGFACYKDAYKWIPMNSSIALQEWPNDVYFIKN